MGKLVMSDGLPKVAILMAAYNGIQWIAEQVESILGQESIDSHLFISVDLSTDGTYEWCRAIEQNHSNVTVLPYGKQFGGAAPNFYRLIKEVDFSLFDYIALSDQDDVWNIDKLSHGINQLIDNKADAYSANVVAFWQNGREKLIEKSQQQKELDYLFEAAGPGCTYIFTNKSLSLVKDYLNKFPELNDFILHDWLAYAILRINHCKWFIDPIPKMRYRQHDLNQVGVNSTFKGKVYRIRYILSGQAFDSVKSLVSALNLSSIQLSTRLGVFKAALNVGQLRRRRIDQFFAFIALLLYGIKGFGK
jgi:rhamnosyltransferase